MVDSPRAKPDFPASPLARLFDARRQLVRMDGGFCTIGDLARRAGMSPAHFLRQFHRTFGETPHQLAIQARFARALELLRTTSLPVTEICFECGYESLGSFSHRFRRELGVSPRVWRKAERRYWPVNITFFHRVVPFCLIESFR